MDPMRPRAVTSPENAQHSTGPTTDDGKARSKMNALKSGWCAKSPVFDRPEDAAAFQDLHAGLLADYAPDTTIWRETLDQLAVLLWQQRRMRRVDDEMEAGCAAQTAADPDPAAEVGSRSGGDSGSGSESAPIAAAATTVAAGGGGLLDLFAARHKELTLALRYVTRSDRAIHRLTQQMESWKKERTAAQAAAAQAAAAQAAAAQAAAAARRETPGGFLLTESAKAAAVAGEKIDWQEVVQQLYYAVSAGPQDGHPLRETYYGAYAIWQKQQWMVEQDIGDDEAGSQLAAVSVAFAMCQAGVRPIPGTVWGVPEDLAQWRERAKKENPFPRWKELVLRDYGRRGVRLEGPEEGKAKENDK